MATTLDEPANRLKRSLNALVSKHEENPDLLGAKKMIDYVLDRPVLMRNKASRTKFLEQMRDELAQLYDAAGVTSSVTSVADPSDAASNAGAADPSDAASNADAMAKIEAQLIDEFVNEHDGQVVQIADDDTWARILNAPYGTKQVSKSGTSIVTLKNTIFFQKPHQDTPLSKVVEFIREAKTADIPITYENNKSRSSIVDEQDGSVKESLRFTNFSVLRNGLPTPEGNRGAIFLGNNLPADLTGVDYLTIFPFDKKAYQIVVDAKNKYDDDIFKYTNDVITQATYQSRTAGPELTPKPALNYLLGIADDRPFEDFVFYNS